MKGWVSWLTGWLGAGFSCELRLVQQTALRTQAAACSIECALGWEGKHGVGQGLVGVERFGVWVDGDAEMDGVEGVCRFGRFKCQDFLVCDQLVLLLLVRE